MEDDSEELPENCNISSDLKSAGISLDSGGNVDDDTATC